MGGVTANNRVPLIIVVVWAYLAAVTSGQVQRQPQWRQQYEGPLASSPHLRGGQQPSINSEPAVGRQLLVSNYSSSIGQQGRQFGQQLVGNQRINTARQQQGIVNQGSRSGGYQQGIQSYDGLNLVQIPKDVLTEYVSIIPVQKDVLPDVVPIIPVASNSILRQSGLLGGQNSGRYNSGLNSNLNSGLNRAQGRPTSFLNSGQPGRFNSAQSQQSGLNRGSSFRAGASLSNGNRLRNQIDQQSSNEPTSSRFRSNPRQLQPRYDGRPDIAIIEDIRDGPHADGSYYFKYGQTDGTIREEGGDPLGPCELRVTGNYYYQAPNGEIIHREYVADGLGHREFPAGARPDIYSPPRRVPVPQPMPLGGMPPCDDGQYRPMGNDGQWRPNGANVYPTRPNTPRPNTPRPNTPRPNTPRPNTPRPNTPRPYTPRPYTPRPNTPRPNTPRPPAPIIIVEPQAPTYIPQPQQQPSPQILNPSPQPSYINPGSGYRPSSNTNVNPVTGLNAAQNPGSNTNILNINTQNNLRNGINSAAANPGLGSNPNVGGYNPGSSGLNSAQNPAPNPSFLNFNTQNNENSRQDRLRALNFNSQNNSG